jgi:hypothetical protein
VLLSLFLKQMLICNRNGYLRLHLHQLVFHVQHQLAQELWRIFRFVDQVVEICA